MRARYYDPVIGRFISEDSVWGKDKDPLSLNLYTYCYSNPIYFIDPSGHTGEYAGAWWGGMWWLPAVDAVLPIGDIIYVGGGILITGAEAAVQYGPQILQIGTGVAENIKGDGSSNNNSSGGIYQIQMVGRTTAKK